MARITLILLLFPLLVSAQEIAITFDDAPTADGPLFTGDQRTDRIVDILRKHHVRQAGFFVLTGNIDEGGRKRLHRYVSAGHLLGNHSHSHRWIHEMGTSAYIRDIRLADSILSQYPGYMKSFRYPFLDEGRTVTARDSIRAALGSMHLTNGYVTVDNYDWYLNHLLVQAVARKMEPDMDALRQIYLDHVYNSISFYDQIARTHIGRSPKHVLLLHENDLTALFLGDLITLLKQRGWKIISPREAYADEISRQTPDVLFNGQGRVAAIAREKGIPARELVQEAEDEVYLDKLVLENKVFR